MRSSALASDRRASKPFRESFPDPRVVSAPGVDFYREILPLPAQLPENGSGKTVRCVVAFVCVWQERSHATFQFLMEWVLGKFIPGAPPDPHGFIRLMTQACGFSRVHPPLVLRTTFILSALASCTSKRFYCNNLVVSVSVFQALVNTLLACRFISNNRRYYLLTAYSRQPLC